MRPGKGSNKDIQNKTDGIKHVWDFHRGLDKIERPAAIWYPVRQHDHQNLWLRTPFNRWSSKSYNIGVSLLAKWSVNQRADVQQNICPKSSPKPCKRVPVQFLISQCIGSFSLLHSLSCLPGPSTSLKHFFTLKIRSLFLGLPHRTKPALLQIGYQRGKSYRRSRNRIWKIIMAQETGVWFFQVYERINVFDSRLAFWNDPKLFHRRNNPRYQKQYLFGQSQLDVLQKPHVLQDYWPDCKIFQKDSDLEHGCSKWPSEKQVPPNAPTPLNLLTEMR